MLSVTDGPNWYEVIELTDLSICGNVIVPPVLPLTKVVDKLAPIQALKFPLPSWYQSKSLEIKTWLPFP